MEDLLKAMFDLLLETKEGVDGLKQEVGGLKQEVGGLKQEVGELKERVEILEQNFKETNTRLNSLETDINEVKANLRSVKELAGFNQESIEAVQHVVTNQYKEFKNFVEANKADHNAYNAKLLQYKK